MARRPVDGRQVVDGLGACPERGIQRCADVADDVAGVGHAPALRHDIDRQRRHLPLGQVPDQPGSDEPAAAENHCAHTETPQSGLGDTARPPTVQCNIPVVFGACRRFCG